MKLKNYLKSIGKEMPKKRKVVSDTHFQGMKNGRWYINNYEFSKEGYLRELTREEIVVAKNIEYNSAIDDCGEIEVLKPLGENELPMFIMKFGATGEILTLGTPAMAKSRRKKRRI